MSERKFFIDLNLNGNQIKSAVIEKLAAAPSAVEGKIYFDTTKHALGIYDGTAWKYMAIQGGAHGSVVEVANNAGAITITYSDGATSSFDLKDTFYTEAEVNQMIADAKQEAKDNLDAFKDRAEGFATSAQGAKADSAIQSAEGDEYVSAEAASNKITVAAKMQAVATASTTSKGIAEAYDVKSYVDNQVAGKNVAAEGDAYVSATAADNKVTVKATDSTKASLAKADSALQASDIATGTANGTISVKGADVAVQGLEDAAFATVESLNATAQGYASTAEQNATAVANQKVASVGATDASIAVDSSEKTAPKVKVQLDGGADNALKLAAGGLRVDIPAEVPYTGSNAIAVEDHAISLKIKEGENVLSQSASGLMSTLSLSWVKAEKKIKLLGIDNAVVAELDASDFVVDGMLADASYNADTHVLTMTLNTDGGSKNIEVNLGGLVDTYTAGDGLALENAKFSVKKATDSESFLVVDANGVAIKGVQGAIDTAKGEAIDAAKSYTDGEVAKLPKYFSKTVEAGTSSPVTIAADEHKCGNNPMVQCYINGELVEMAIAIQAGAVNVAWNGSLESALTVVIVGL